MSIPGSATPLLLATTAAAPAAAVQIDRSLRFNSADSAYLDRTPSSAGNRKTWTWSGWIKRSAINNGANVRHWIFIGGNVASDTGIGFIGFKQNDDLLVGSNNTDFLLTTRKFRDLSAWYHIVVAFDSTQATASNRIKVYVNGVEETDFSTDNRSSVTQNGDFGWNRAEVHNIGRVQSYAGNTVQYIDAYMADVHFIDGQALAPTDFGQTDSDNNWNPKAFSGTYGTNGFHLDFSDNSSNSALGEDSSGNNNDWTVNNIAYGPTTKTFTHAKADGSAWGNIANAFDGSTSTYADGTYNNGTTAKIYFNPPLTGVTSLRVYWYGTSNYGYNDTSKGTGSTTAGWYSMYSGSAITVNNIIGISQPGNGVVRLYAIEVNGSNLTGYTNLDPADIDSLIDTPTNYDADSGNNGGNYCVWNPLKPTNGAHSEGNLKFVGNSNWCHTPGTLLLSSGKWYFEGTYKGSQYGSGQGNIVSGIGFIRADAALGEGSNQEPVNTADFRSNTLAFYQNGYFTNLSTHSSVRTQISEGDVVGVSINFDAGTYAFYVNNSSVASGSLSYTGPFLPWTHVYYNNSFYDCNFGARPFVYTPPTGHLSLCTQNLPDPTIADGSTAFDAVTYSGNGTTQTITSINHSPDFVWIKCRNDSVGHQLFDQVRGAGKSLLSNTTDQERTNHIYGYLSAFTSDGFTVTAGSSDDFEVNGSSETYVAWNWDAGTSTVSNTAGSITSNVRANQSAGFSIVTYEADAPNNVIGHGLNTEPYFVITKARDRTDNWLVYHYDLGVNKWLHLNLSSAVITTSGIWGTASNWTSSTFGVSTSSIEGNNYGSHDYVAYCFAPVSQFSSFGSYTGNGSSDGPFVYTGFRVRFLLVKNADNTDGWSMWDAARDPDNEVVNKIEPNSSGAEGTNSVHKYDFLSNGFKVRGNWNGFNGSGNTIIYAAFAEHPFSTARAR